MINHRPVPELFVIYKDLKGCVSLNSNFVVFKKTDWFVEGEDIRLILIISGALISSSLLNSAKALFEIIDLLSQPPGVVGRFLINLFPYLGQKASRHLPHHMLNLIPELVKVESMLMVSWWRLVDPRNRLLFVESHLKVFAVLLQLLQISNAHVVC